MRDRFGKVPVFVPEEDGTHFHFDVPVCVSPQFYGWVCGFDGKVEVTAPAEVRQRPAGNGPKTGSAARLKAGMRTALLCAKTFFDRIAQGDLRICLGFLFARPNHFPDFCAALPCHSAANSQLFLCMFHKIAHPPPRKFGILS